MARPHLSPLLAALALCLAAPVQANDSEAEIGIGGIILTPSDAIRLDSEDLYISAERVEVSYRFTNPTDRAITTTVAFPMPRQPSAMGDLVYDPEAIVPWGGFGFATYVDGAPVRLRQVDRAMIGDKDVTQRIEALGWPVIWFDDAAFMAEVAAMDRDPAQSPYIGEGLLTADRYAPDRLVPAWEVATYFVREQYFPAGSSMTVRHEYVPQVGGSVGGALDKRLRDEMPEILESYAQDYCVDDYLLAGLDRRMASPSDSLHAVFYSETWVGYILSSGSNWNGPIGDFRLVVDKGDPANLVSFCMDGVTKISPTRFEVRKSDFEPDRDLDILILRFHEYESD